MIETEVPLFLLDTVLFPEGCLPLRVFEPRYLDMLGRCMRADSPFGVVLIREGREVGRAAIPCSTGTLAKVSHWDKGPDGILEIVAGGMQRFRILDTRVERDQLTVARTQPLAGKPGIPVPFRFQSLSLGLKRILTRVEENSLPPAAPRPLRFEDAEWVGLRLAEILPMESSIKQVLLEIEAPVQRLEHISAWIAAQERA